MPSLTPNAILLRRLLLTAGFVGMAAALTPMPAQTTSATKGRILFVVTSHGQITATGKSTGFYLSEVSHPWEILHGAGYEIDFVSPQGGKAPVDGFDLTDPANREFWENPEYRTKIEHTRRPSEVDPRDYLAIHFAGGHGTMWDFADNPALAALAARIYQHGGVVSAVSHGPAGLVNIRLANGKYLVAGKRVNAFTNEEEAAVKLDRVVPFLLESKLIERGAIFEKSPPWQRHVVTDQRLITGQNPQSAHAVGAALLEQIRHVEVVGRFTRYDVKAGAEESVQSALSAYVTQALAAEGALHAEAFHERDNRRVLWLIERWQNQHALQRFANRPPALALSALASSALKEEPAVHVVTDLAPLSPAEWRRRPREGDTPLTVVLFVDAKDGTQDTFREVYHRAMPAFRSEPGVVNYQISQFRNDDTKFVTYEKFRSDAAFDFHLKFPPIQPVIDFLNTSIKREPFQDGLHFLIEFAPLEYEKP